MTPRTCRGCESPDLQTVLQLGSVPAADFFPVYDETSDMTDSLHPLAMSMCRVCGLAQLADDDTVTDEPRGIEPRALVDQAAHAVAAVAAAGWLTGGSVREFGSPHGGTWVPLLEARGYHEIDSDHEEAARSVDLVLDCFGIMHEPDQAAAFALRASSLAEGGVLLLQFHSLTAIVEHEQWNALRHGHFAYYSLTALTTLLARAGLVARSAWTFELYGGTVLVAAARSGESDNTVKHILDEEKARGMDNPATVAALQTSVDADISSVRDSLAELQRDGKSVYAYGAASRAVALFAMAHLTTTSITGVADASPAKQGRRMPGTDIGIIAPAELVAAKPDVVLLTLPDLHVELDHSIPELRGRWWLHGADLRKGTR